MPSHPPIPPNCKYFYLDDDGKRWFYILEPDIGDGYRVSCQVCCVTAQERLRCAAVARCAWLDEEPRRMEELGVEEDLDGGLYLRDRPYPINEPESDEELDAQLKIFEEGDAEEKRRIALVRECLTNANAWAKWGRGEDWARKLEYFAGNP